MSLLAWNNHTIVNQYFINSMDANLAQNAISRELNRSPEKTDREQVVLRLAQGNSSNNKNGNFGWIEDIHSERVKVSFKNDAIRERVLNVTGNPFTKFYKVDVNVSYSEIKEKPVLYNIIAVYEDWDLDD
jgi:hypothetical protein